MTSSLIRLGNQTWLAGLKIQGKLPEKGKKSPGRRKEFDPLKDSNLRSQNSCRDFYLPSNFLKEIFYLQTFLKCRYVHRSNSGIEIFKEAYEHWKTRNYNPPNSHPIFIYLRMSGKKDSKISTVIKRE